LCRQGLSQQAQHAITAIEQFGKNEVEENVEDQRQAQYGGAQKYQEIDHRPAGKTAAG
jgi:hypothetical protein